MAGAAIGVSHLVQSTRAGADYGLALLFLVVLVNLLKLPFFAVGHTYAVATGESLVRGYQRMGKGYLYLFLVLNFVAAVGSVAGVTVFTAGLVQYIFGIDWTNVLTSVAILLVCLGIVAGGHFKALDLVIKLIMATLFVATFLAVGVALAHGPAASLNADPVAGLQKVQIGFLVALLGWMPAPIEVSVWQSLWIQAKRRSDRCDFSAKESRFDFHVGYGSCIILAVAFMTLGAYVMHGTEMSFAATSAGFAQQLIDLYVRTLGNWAAPFIMVAALTTMFSTTLTVFDGYSRSLAEVVRIEVPALENRFRLLHLGWMLLTGVLALLVIGTFPLDRFVDLIDLVTTIAFLAAPVFSLLNFLLARRLPAGVRPGPRTTAWSILGLVVLSGIGLAYLGSLVGL